MLDHDLALALWDTGNLDARNLACKVVDPARMTSADLDRWARESTASRTWGGYVGMVAAAGGRAISGRTGARRDVARTPGTS